MWLFLTAMPYIISLQAKKQGRNLFFDSKSTYWLQCDENHSDSSHILGTHEKILEFQQSQGCIGEAIFMSKSH